MSKALYRKYRSKSFDEVIGQEHITTTLKKALDTGAISHAYLFTGPRGVGKTSVARILAYAVNGLPYEEESTHLDIIEIDAASNRRIDEIRDLRDKIHIAPTSARYKVYIIDEVHMLTREAFNALLKTLEEPPEHAIFILATTEAHKVPETIISRTQRFQFKPISKQRTVDHLKTLAKKEGFQIDEESLELLAEHGSGSFRDSISMLDQVSGQNKIITVDNVRLLLGIPEDELLFHILEAIKSQSAQQIFSTLETAKEHGIDAGQLAKALSRMLKEQLLNSSLILSQDATIKLLQKLVVLTASSADYYYLEICLLSQLHDTQSHDEPDNKKANTRSSQKVTEKKQEVLSTATEPANKAEMKEIPQTSKERIIQKNQPQPEVEQGQETASPPNGNWAHLLQNIKKTHNTLYGLLRQSTISEINGELIICFAFPFHKKQVDSAKLYPVLKEAIQHEYGTMPFKTIVEKSTSLPLDNESQGPTTKKTDELSAISNIFGSAELLES